MKIESSHTPVIITLSWVEADEFLGWLGAQELDEDVAVSLYEALYAELFPLGEIESD